MSPIVRNSELNATNAEYFLYEINCIERVEDWYLNETKSLSYQNLNSATSDFYRLYCANLEDIVRSVGGIKGYLAEFHPEDLDDFSANGGIFTAGILLELRKGDTTLLASFLRYDPASEVLIPDEFPKIDIDNLCQGERLIIELIHKKITNTT